MRFNGSKTASIVFLAFMSSTFAFSAGKKSHAASKAAVKECIEKGGTWDKKKKKCDTANTDAAQEAPAATETAPSSEPTPHGDDAPVNP